MAILLRITAEKYEPLPPSSPIDTAGRRRLVYRNRRRLLAVSPSIDIPSLFPFPSKNPPDFHRKFHLDSKHPRFLASSLFQISTGVDGGVSTPENNFVGTKFAPPRLLYTVGKGSQLIDTLLPTNATNDSCSRTVISNRAWLGFTGSVFVNQFD